MTNYFKVYLTDYGSGKTIKVIVKTPNEVRKLINQVKNGKYQVIKRIKGGTDVPVGLGFVSNGARRVLNDHIDTDYRVVGNNVVDYSGYKKAQEEKDR